MTSYVSFSDTWFEFWVKMVITRSLYFNNKLLKNYYTFQLVNNLCHNVLHYTDTDLVSFSSFPYFFASMDNRCLNFIRSRKIIIFKFQYFFYIYQQIFFCDRELSLLYGYFKMYFLLKKQNKFLIIFSLLIFKIRS